MEILVKDLPSGKDFYCDNQRIVLEKYTYGQLIKLTQSDDITIIEDSLKAIKCNFDILDKYKGLAYSDYQYIQLFRRLSVPDFEKFSVTYNCVKCNKSNVFLTQVKELHFAENKIGKISNFPVKVQYSDNAEDTLEFMPFTMAMHLELLKKETHDLISVQAIMIQNKGFEEAKKILELISDEQFITDMGELGVLLNWGLKPISKVCSKCGHVNTVPIDDDSVLLSPKSTAQRTNVSRIFYGK